MINHYPFCCVPSSSPSKSDPPKPCHINKAISQFTCRTMTGKLTRKLGKATIRDEFSCPPQCFENVSSYLAVKNLNSVLGCCRDLYMLHLVQEHLNGDQYSWETLRHIILWESYLYVRRLLLNWWLSSLVAY